ncbi:MAG: ABC transporter permease [Verrucomicrobia bacterium]|nr:ABC transporter permease [Verrucomicrobiota bacterium]
MNLATKDIRHNFGRFALTTVGIGLLLMIVMGMGGIYRGLIREATLLVDKIGADFWVVQGSTRGPFAEISRGPANLEDRARAVPGVAGARRFVSHTIQREHGGRPLRIVVQGLAWPEDRGAWSPLVAGRPLRQAHFEMIADRSLGLPLGERLKLGKDVYEVVGLTKGMVGTSGDGLCFFTVSDAEAIQFDVPGEAVRLERQSRRARAEAQDIGQMQPLLLERAAGPASGIPALALQPLLLERAAGPARGIPARAPPRVSAVMVTLQPGANAAEVAATFATWPDITVYSTQQQIDLLLAGMVDKAKRQLGLFRVLLIIISTIIMALIIYTLTLDKIHDIAMLKLMGARNGVIISLILQQALLIGALGYGLAYWLGTFAFPQFPRLVVIETPDLLSLAAIVLGISVLSSLLGIWKAMRVEPNKVLS